MHLEHLGSFATTRRSRFAGMLVAPDEHEREQRALEGVGIELRAVARITPSRSRRRTRSNTAEGASSRRAPDPRSTCAHPSAGSPGAAVNGIEIVEHGNVSCSVPDDCRLGATDLDDASTNRPMQG